MFIRSCRCGVYGMGLTLSEPESGVWGLGLENSMVEFKGLVGWAEDGRLRRVAMVLPFGATTHHLCALL